MKAAYEDWRDLAVDRSRENMNLYEQIAELTTQLNSEKRRRIDAEMRLRFATEKLQEAGLA